METQRNEGENKVSNLRGIVKSKNPIACVEKEAKQFLQSTLKTQTLIIIFTR